MGRNAGLVRMLVHHHVRGWSVYTGVSLAHGILIDKFAGHGHCSRALLATFHSKCDVSGLMLNGERFHDY